jgi:hypothetical protein
LLNEDNLRLFVKLLGYPDTYSLHLASIQYFKKIFSFMLLEYLHCSNPAQIGQIVEQKKKGYEFGSIVCTWKQSCLVVYTLHRSTNAIPL